MKQLLFRLCEASDGRIYSFLTDQPDAGDFFDSGYKVAYKHRDKGNSDGLLARWRSSYTVKTDEFEQLPEKEQLPDAIKDSFNSMVSTLLPGVDVMFCDYNLGIEADLPICNDMMDSYRSTDFVLFSCEELIGNDPRTQPYMVSYAVPRYPETGNASSQHRIYSKTESFAFARAINAIVNQRERDALNGGHIRTEVDVYMGEPPVTEAVAEKAIKRFVETIQHQSNGVNASVTSGEAQVEGE